MKLLQKILFVAMIGVFGWNVSGMIPPPPPPTPPTLNLPNNTPGLQGTLQNQIINTVANIRCHHVIIPGTAAGIAFNNAGGIANVNAARAAAMVVDGNVYFPRNGVQPTTAEAAQYSCARVADTGHGTPGRAITDWYIRAFGGNRALNLSNGIAPPAVDNVPQIGFAAVGGAAHIITVDMTGAPPLFDRNFWQTFRTIASDPVGRVLLYRILIEIRRQNAGNGVCEMVLATLHDRNNCRSITINHDPIIGFVIGQGIDFHFNPVQTALLHIQHNNIFTYDMPRTPDIALFHEMMHWFHYLRHPMRYNNDGIADTYQYLTRCYYADVSELFTWCEEAIDNEEIRTILGTPNCSIQGIRNLIHASTFFNVAAIGREQVNDTITGLVANHFIVVAQKFLNGDDLSENAYRMSRHAPPGNNVRMRWGHGEPIARLSINAANNSVNEPHNVFNNQRFRLANLVATQCYQDITNNGKIWQLGNGATEP